jgi:hypothetical protein
MFDILPCELWLLGAGSACCCPPAAVAAAAVAVASRPLKRTVVLLVAVAVDTSFWLRALPMRVLRNRLAITVTSREKGNRERCTGTVITIFVA